MDTQKINNNCYDVYYFMLLSRKIIVFYIYLSVKKGRAHHGEIHFLESDAERNLENTGTMVQRVGAEIHLPLSCRHALVFCRR